jgi:hypothetical protein
LNEALGKQNPIAKGTATMLAMKFQRTGLHGFGTFPVFSPIQHFVRFVVPLHVVKKNIRLAPETADQPANTPKYLQSSFLSS